MNDFTELFKQLRAIMLEAAGDQVIAKDEPGDLILHRRHLDSSGKAEWFGAVTIKKSYVSYHLFPLYTDPTLGDSLSAELSARRQGKSCFNFKKASPDTFLDLAKLTKASAKDRLKNIN